MAHYALLNENNEVVNVIVGKDESNFNWEQFYSFQFGLVCKRTSYNTKEGIHFLPNSNTPSPDQSKAFRKNYAGIGYTYDPQRDAFIPPKPYQSWVIDEFSCTWKPPIPYPTDTNTEYFWDETILNWKPITGDSND